MRMMCSRKFNSADFRKLLKDVTPQARINERFYEALVLMYANVGNISEALRFSQMSHEQGKSNAKIYAKWIEDDAWLKQVQN